MSKFKGRNAHSFPGPLAGALSGILLVTHAVAQERSPSSAVSRSDTIEEIVVTASKRTENIQTVPASVSVQAGDLLLYRNQGQLSEYANNVPGLNVGNLGKAGLASVNLRGIASVSNSASVAGYVDEVPLGSSSRWGNASNQIPDVLPYDLDRLEVLRGPQGTLYGAGAMGGLIKYVLKSADTHDFEARLGADAGGIDGAGNASYSVRGAVNMPLVKDVLGLRISLYDKHTPGYIDNVRIGEKDANKQVQNGGRAALLWQPTEDLSIKLAALLSHNEADDGGTISYAGFTPVVTTDGSSIGEVFAPYGNLKQSHAFPQAFRANTALYSATINWNLGAVELVSATGWSNQDTRTSVDQSLAIIPFIAFGILPPGTLLGGETDIEVEKFTQELRLVSPQEQTLEWMVGAFYTDETAKLDGSLNGFGPAYEPIPFLTPAIFNQEESTYEEYAFFGDATWHLAEQFDLGAGVRYANNEQTYGGVSGGPFGGGPVSYPDADEDVTTWSLSARYHFNPDVMLYSRIATGYRAGGPNVPVVATLGLPPRVDSDTLTNYEVGVKSEFLDRRALLNVTAFFIDWEDIQLNSTQNGNTILTNGGKAESKGVEFTGELSPVEGLKLGLYAAYTDSELKSISPGAFFLTGYQLPGVPKWSYSVTADYDWSVAADWDAHVGAGLRWVDKQWLTGVQLAGKAAPAVEAPSYTLVNAYASLTHDRWTFKAYATNLTNQRAIQGGLELIDLLNGPQQGDFWIVQPRAIGVGVDMQF